MRMFMIDEGWWSAGRLLVGVGNPRGSGFSRAILRLVGEEHEGDALQLQIVSHPCQSLFGFHEPCWIRTVNHPQYLYVGFRVLRVGV